MQDPTVSESQDIYQPNWVPLNFLALPPELTSLEKARAVIVPIPYDSTTSFRGGARDAPLAIIQASGALEDYDTEIEADVSHVGIHTTPFLEAHMGSPQAMVNQVYMAISPLAKQGKLVGLVGGEHTVSVGAVKAMKEVWADLSVLYLDAHADLRDEYMGTRWGHASVARRLSEMCPVVQLGVRSMCLEEVEYIKHSDIKVWEMSADRPSMPSVEEVVESLSSNVYISIDLDVLDSGVMPAVGTPEPGGLDWYQLTRLLRGVGEVKRIVGFDVTELSPGLGPEACAYTAAKLIIKLIAYALFLSGSQIAGGQTSRKNQS